MDLKSRPQAARVEAGAYSVFARPVGAAARWCLELAWHSLRSSGSSLVLPRSAYWDRSFAEARVHPNQL